MTPTAKTLREAMQEQMRALRAYPTSIAGDTSIVAQAIVSELGITEEMVEALRRLAVGDVCNLALLEKVHDALSALLEVAGEAP